MYIDISESTSLSRQEINPPIPKPGEIWELCRLVRSPLKFSEEEQKNLYSDVAKQFLEGNSPPRYVMIVREPEPPIEPESQWQIVYVMLMSVETTFLNDLDLVIPSKISGVGQDLLAQTWHLLPMLTCNLSRLVGKRLSRELYDLLLTVGDDHHGLIDQPPPIQEIQALGLEAGTVLAKQQLDIQSFHRQEEDWSDVLSVPLAAYRTYLKTLKFTDVIFNEALQIERELTEVSKEALNQVEVETSSNIAPAPASSVLSKTRITLSHWFENLFESEWQAIASFWSLRPNLAIATRSTHNSDDVCPEPHEIAALIDQLSLGRDEHQHRRAAKRLGEIAAENSEAISALVNLVRTTKDDETLWTAIESLWQIDPGNSAAGARRVKVVDLGMPVAGQSVALALALIQKNEQQVGILLQVYPTGSAAYLPSDLKLILLDGAGQILREITARRADIYIQLKFSGQLGEQFSVRVGYETASITEDFVI